MDIVESNTQHSEDYKMTAVIYYLENKEETNLRAVCDIFSCKFQSLYRWIKKYENTGELKRKERENKKLKITLPIMEFVKQEIEKVITLTLLELSLKVKEKFNVEFTDILNISAISFCVLSLSLELKTEEVLRTHTSK